MTTPYYQDDLVTIWHGDCREWMPDADVIVTDPPYGIASKWQGGCGSGWDAARRKQTVRNQWDTEAPDLGHLVSRNRPMIVWGGNHFVLPVSRGWLVWRKETTGFSLADAELAWTTLDQPIRVFDHARNKLTGAAVPEHPTAKPLPLMVWSLGWLAAGLVLDPYAGSGTTLVAAKALGRRAIGIEIDERYCEIAAIRCSQEVLGLEVPA